MAITLALFPSFGQAPADVPAVVRQTARVTIGNRYILSLIHI